MNKTILYYIAFLLLSSCNHIGSASQIDSTATITTTKEIAFIKTVEATYELTNKRVLLDFTLSPDGNMVAVYLNTGVYIYDLENKNIFPFIEFETGEYLDQLPAYYLFPINGPGAIAFSPDGKEIAVSGKNIDEVIRVWDWKNREIIQYIANYPNGNYVRELEFSLDGNVLLIRSTYPISRLHCEVGSEDSIILVNLSLQEKIYENTGCNHWSSIEYYLSEKNSIYIFHFGESILYQGKKINTQSGEILKIYDYNTELEGRIYDVSGDGKVFATYDYSTPGEYQTKLVDSETSRQLMIITGRVILLDDRNRYLVGNSDGQWRLYEDNSLLCQYNGLDNQYTKVDWKNNTLAIATKEENIQIWDIPSCKLIITISSE